MQGRQRESLFVHGLVLDNKVEIREKAQGRIPQRKHQFMKLHVPTEDLPVELIHHHGSIQRMPSHPLLSAPLCR